MTSIHKNSYASAASSKRPAPQLQRSQESSKPGVFVPSASFLTFLNDKVVVKNVTHSFPKSQMEYGLRIYHGVEEPYLYETIHEKIKTLYPEATALEGKPTSGFFDLGFKSAAMALEATKRNFTVAYKKLNHQTRPVSTTMTTVRVITEPTRYYDDNNLFVVFEGLPTTVPRNELCGMLEAGCKEYGDLINFQMEKHTLSPHLTSTRAVALIRPSPAVAKDVTLIPRRAIVFPEDKTEARIFRVRADKSPPICTICSNIGHKVEHCPSNWNTVDTPTPEDMSDGENFNALTPHVWGDHAELEKIAPMTKAQRKAARNKAKAATTAPDSETTPNATSNEVLSETVTPPVTGETEKPQDETMNEIIVPVSQDQSPTTQPPNTTNTKADWENNLRPPRSGEPHSASGPTTRSATRAAKQHASDASGLGLMHS